MYKKYLSKIIATDNEGLQVISACCSGAEVKVDDIKYLQTNKVFLLSLNRSKVEIILARHYLDIGVIFHFWCYN